MHFEIVSKFACFKNSILKNNRFFISDDPFLIEFKKHILRDLKRENPIMVSEVPKGKFLYRARIMDNYLKGEKYSVTKAMQNYGSELTLMKCCEKCQNTEGCNNDCQKPTKKTAEHFKNQAREMLQKITPSSELNFNGFDSKDSSLPPEQSYNAVSDARANPKYIRYLYAANDRYTALLEARSNINSLVSVANIEILEPLRILDITNPMRSSIEDEELFMLLYELNDEFSTPAAGELKDYLATQVVSEFVKCFDCFPKFDGICFRSSLNLNGKNYTIFAEKKYQPISSEVYYINDVALTAYCVTEEKSVDFVSNISIIEN